MRPGSRLISVGNQPGSIQIVKVIENPVPGGQGFSQYKLAVQFVLVPKYLFTIIDQIQMLSLVILPQEIRRRFVRFWIKCGLPYASHICTRGWNNPPQPDLPRSFPRELTGYVLRSTIGGGKGNADLIHIGIAES